MLTATGVKGTRGALSQCLRSNFKCKNVALKSTSTVTLDQRSQSGKHDEDTAKQSTFSHTISFASPESDFVNSHLLLKPDLDCDNKEEHGLNWSDSLSFSSPESDFSSTPIMKREHQVEKTATMEAKEAFLNNYENNHHERNKIAYSLSYATSESDFCNPEFTSMLSERQKKQLNNTSLLPDLTEHEYSGKDSISLEYEELRAHANLLSHEDPLPSSMEEATIDDDDRAIVITEAQVPFHITSVNSSWEHLCGFTKDECRGKTLNCIQGEETNQAAVTALMSQLLRGEEAGTVLVNYRKDGSKFLNRLRVGPLRDDQNAITHFVGVLKEVKEMEDQFHQSSEILA